MARRVTPSSRPSSNHLSGFSSGNGSGSSNSGSTIGSNGAGSHTSNSATSSHTSHSHTPTTSTWWNNSSKFSAAAAQYNSYAGGTGGSPFPPLGFAAAFSSSPLASSEKSPSPFTSAPAAEAFPSSAFPSLSNASASPAKMPAHNHHHDSGSSSVGLPPAPTKFDASQAQACRLQDVYWSDDEVRGAFSPSCAFWSLICFRRFTGGHGLPTLSGGNRFV